MSITVHQRPGVYSSYDASGLVSGSGAGRLVGLAGINTAVQAGTVQTVTSYDQALTLFGDQGSEGMAELIRELKGLGYGIYLLSNAKADLPLYFDRIPGSECFDGRIVSADWKLLKPQPEIYETLLREFRLKPEECFFIDDLSVNVEGARRAGLDGAVFFGDIPRLRRELIAAGVPCAPGEVEP